MKVGFTGTKKGMTQAQKDRFKLRLNTLIKCDELHHGDCIGADADAHDIAVDILTYGTDDIVIHPGPNENINAYREASTIMDIRTHFKNNRAIVDSCDILIAVPNNMIEQAHGKTWYTVNYARKNHKPVIIIWPNGDIDHENNYSE